MRTVAIIQARINSTRLPGKILLPMAGKTMLWHITDRVKRAKTIDAVVIGAPTPEDLLEIVGEVDIKGLAVSRPAKGIREDDLIGRYYDLAIEHEAELVVRVCSDNPFVDPAEIDRAVEFFNATPVVFVSNQHNHSCCENGYPDGVGCEVFSFATLNWMHETLKKKQYREHPHMYFHDKNVVSSPQAPDAIRRPDIRLDVNTKRDYDRMSFLFENVYEKNPEFSTREVINAYDKIYMAERTSSP